MAVVVSVKSRSGRGWCRQLFKPRNTLHQGFALLPVGECLVGDPAEPRDPTELDCPRRHVPSGGRTQKECSEATRDSHRGCRVLLGKVFCSSQRFADRASFQTFLCLTNDTRHHGSCALGRGSSLLRGLAAKDRVEQGLRIEHGSTSSSIVFTCHSFRSVYSLANTLSAISAATLTQRLGEYGPARARAVEAAYRSGY